MQSLEAELEAARGLSESNLADAIESIGFECTRCGACCQGTVEDPHTATIFPDEIRELQSGATTEWRDIARPMPFGLDPDGGGETFEWALQTDACGDCTFYNEGADESPGTCTVYSDRPLICETYPFSVDIAGATPMGAVVDRVGSVNVHECEGVGRDIDREDAEQLASTLKRRAIRELEEAIAVRDTYTPTEDDGPVVHDSEGAKQPDGIPLDQERGPN